MPKIGSGKKASGGPSIGKGKPAKGGGPSISPATPVSGPSSAPPQPGGTWNPGEENARVEPYATGQQIMEYAEARKSYEESLAALDSRLEESVTNTNYEEAGLAKNAVSEKVGHSEEFAGRGLGRSSIRDSDMYDIDAAAAMRKAYLDTQLSSIKLNTDTQKTILNTNWNKFTEGFKIGEVENAQNANSGIPQWKVEPHMEAAPAKPQATKQNPQNAKAFGEKIKQAAPVKQNAEISPKGAAGLGPSAPVRPKTGVSGSKKVAGKLYG